MINHDRPFSRIAPLGSAARVVIPAELRKRMGWNVDEALRIRLEEGEVRIRPGMDGLRRAQAMVAALDKGSGSIVAEVIADRRAETAKDEAETRE